MPLYEYVCAACSRRFEKIQKFSDPAPDACPHCGQGPVVRQLSSPAIQFKGSGFYITDYAKKGAGANDSSGQDKADKSDKSGKPDKADGKSDSASGGAGKTEAAPAAPAAAPAKTTTDS